MKNKTYFDQHDTHVDSALISDTETLILLINLI